MIESSVKHFRISSVIALSSPVTVFVSSSQKSRKNFLDILDFFTHLVDWRIFITEENMDKVNTFSI